MPLMAAKIGMSLYFSVRPAADVSTIDELFRSSVRRGIPKPVNLMWL